MSPHPPVAPLRTLLRCPCCMSRLHDEEAASDPVLHCDSCARVYPLAHGGIVPRLKRDDALATLAQDIVVYQDDPASTRLDRRRLVWHMEQRERFLAELRCHAAGATPAGGRERADATQDEAFPHELAPLHKTFFDRFVGLLPASATVLDLGCGEGLWTARLSREGLRVIGADASSRDLMRAVALRHAGEETLFVEAEALEMPFASASLHGIWCADAFASVRLDRRTVFFRQVNRVLRPGGILFVSAATKPLAAVVRRYLLWRVVLRRPVLLGEYVDGQPGVPGRGSRQRAYRRRHYQAMISARALRALCRDHGLRVMSLRQEGARWLLLARKTRGTEVTRREDEEA